MKRAIVAITVALVACTQEGTPQQTPQAPVATSAPVSARSNSRIARLVIDRVESPTFEGRAFGDAGQYEKLVGRAFGEVDPASPVDATIVNIDKAPRNARGMVEYDVDFYVLKPLSMDRGSKTLFYDVVNRGNKTAFSFNFAPGGNDPTKAGDAGDGFLLRQGYTVVWSGWQGDTLPGNERLTARFPVATNRDGTPIRRVIRTEFVFDRPLFSVPISFDRGSVDVRPYAPVQESLGSATLSRRKGPEASSEAIPRDQWSFARCADGQAKTPSSTDVCLPAGFSPDFIYDLVYEARDPLVMGVGFAATRDLVSFLRYETSDANPLVQRGGTAGKSPIQWALGFGSSQSGRFLKDLVYQGFNQDGAGRRVFDGAIPHISGSRRTYTNYEFAMPGRFSTNLEGHHYPGDQFPFTYETIADPISGKTDGVLARCSAQGACPKIMHWDSGTEFWSARSSLVVTDPRGAADVPIPANVRLYYFASTQHGPAATSAKGICQQTSNPLQYRDTQRALLVALQGWVATGAEPPPTRYPRLGDGALVPPLPQSAPGFPTIPGVRYTGKPNHLFLIDSSVQPPRHVPGSEYRVLVPKVDADGNETAGVRSTTLRAPLGTYAGWNLRAKGFMEDEGCYLSGSYIPFAATVAQRAAGDSRPSLEERYGTRQKYVDTVTVATRALVSERFLLAEDAERLVKAAQTEQLWPGAK